MKKARVFIVEDAFEKFADLVGLVMERLRQEMRATENPPSPNRSLLAPEKYDAKVQSILRSVGLSMG